MLTKHVELRESLPGPGAILDSDDSSLTGKGRDGIGFYHRFDRRRNVVDPQRQSRTIADVPVMVQQLVLGVVVVVRGGHRYGI